MLAFKGPQTLVIVDDQILEAVARMPFHGCPAAPSASKGSLRRVEGLNASGYKTL